MEEKMKKNVTIGIVIVVIAVLIFAGMQLFKKTDCNEVLKSANKLVLDMFKCIAQCAKDSTANLQSCSNVCVNTSIEASKKLTGSDPNLCDAEITEIIGSEAYAPFATDSAACSIKLEQSIMAKSTNSSASIDDACLIELKQKYPQYIA